MNETQEALNQLRAAEATLWAVRNGLQKALTELCEQKELPWAGQKAYHIDAQLTAACHEVRDLNKCMEFEVAFKRGEEELAS